MINQQVILDDEEARTRIIKDLDTTFLVEAGAGSGKTTSIVGRMIALIRSRKVEVRNIAAITFTNKAATELMGRFRLKLETELNSVPTGEEHDALENAIRQLPECFIGTIHAFCGRLLRERPIEAGLDPAFQEMEQQEDQEFRNQCWDNYLNDLRTNGATDLIEELFQHRVHVEDLRAVYNKVSEYEDVEIFSQSVARPDFDIIRHSLFPLMNEAASYLPTIQPERDWDDLQKIIRIAMRHVNGKNMDEDMNVLTVAKLFDRTLGVTLNRWTDPKMAKQFKEQFHDWQRTTLYPFLRSWREFLHPKLIDFVMPAVRYCNQKRMEAGKLNFQDLLMKAADLLRSYPEIRKYFGRRYTRLFVDEFQDTDPVQAEMMMLLTGANEEENDWKRQQPRAGSLFVVGDPKQSIYRFRRADVSTYNFVKERINECGDVLQLTRNFRSVKSIGDYVNYAFESKFVQPDKSSDAQAPFVRMVTQLDNPVGSKKNLHGVHTLTVPKQERHRQWDIAEYDAERIAQFIAWACAGNLYIQDNDHEGRLMNRMARPGDFLILHRFRRFIDLYAVTLDKYGVSADTSGSQIVFEEIQAIYLLTLTLGDPTDRVALLDVLRGLLFGISDDELYHYRQEEGSIHLYSNVDYDILSDKGKKVQQAICKLRQFMEWVNTMPALSAFTCILNDIGLIPSIASGESGAIRSGTLIKLLEVLQNDPDASINWQSLCEKLNRLTTKERMEAASLFTGSGNAVRIMNLHKAKGLEAPVVMMSCPCGNIDHDATEHVDRLSEPSLGYFSISRPKDSFNDEIIAQPVGWEEYAEKEREFKHAEKDRLLYVAVTRAKQLLIISQYPSKPAIDPWSSLATTLQHQVELDVTPVDPVQPKELTEIPDIVASLSKWQNKLEQCSQLSYQVTSVTGDNKTSNVIKLERSLEGKGMAYGSLVHRCLQMLGEGMELKDLTDFCSLAAEEEGVEEQWIKQAEEMILQVTGSDLWKRCMNSLQRYHEFSFMATNNVTNSDAPTTTILRGIIDLVFEEEDGWVIVDFKTDRYNMEQEQQFVDYYSPQVRAYASEWERIIGSKVKEAGLYFLDTNRYIHV